MKTRWPGSLLAIAFLATSLIAQNRDGLVEALREAPAWELRSEPVEYSADNIEMLAPGSAMAILEYGLIGVSTMTVAGPEGVVNLVLYEMVDSAASYGLFTLERSWDRPDFETVPLGTEGFRIGDELIFWQSKYVGRIRGPWEATEALGRVLTDNIFGLSRKAPVSQHLPPEGLIGESEKYILDPTTFERAAALNAEGLGFEDSLEVAVATYGKAVGSATLALLLYPTRQLAEFHLQEWLASIEGEQPYRQVGPLVAIVSASDAPDVAEDILSRVNHQYSITWNVALPDPLTLPEMILTIFAWIGIALLFTLIVGIAFGGFRIYMKTHHPNRLFLSEEAERLIELKINQPVTRKQLNE